MPFSWRSFFDNSSKNEIEQAFEKVLCTQMATPAFFEPARDANARAVREGSGRKMCTRPLEDLSLAHFAYQLKFAGFASQPARATDAKQCLLTGYESINVDKMRRPARL